jgi:enoyl-CoA hydratase/carnithine racemase
MGFEAILYSTADRIATITLNRPDRLNAWTRQMDEEVREAMAKAGADPEVRAVVLTGAGRGFCAGADMDTLNAIQGSGGERARAPATLPWQSGARPDFRMTYSYFPTVPKLIIGAINGPCAGLGMVISLYCDMRFCADSAVFTTAFAARGLIAEHGISWLLPKLVGLPHAMDLLCSARKVRGQEAAAMGLVNRSLPDADLLPFVRSYAKALAETVSPRSVAVMKRQLWEAQFQNLAEATLIGNAEMQESFKSADFKEGVAHFVEKRAPRFAGH